MRSILIQPNAADVITFVDNNDGTLTLTFSDGTTQVVFESQTGGLAGIIIDNNRYILKPDPDVDFLDFAERNSEAIVFATDYPGP